MIRHRFVAAAAIFGLVASGCSGGDDTNAAPDDEQPTTTELRLADGQTLHRIGAIFQYGAFEVTVGDTVYDSSAEQLAMGLRFRNLSDSWAQPETAATLDVGGAELPVLGTVVDIPPRMSADLTWTIDSLTQDPVPDGVLRWGRPDRDQPVISLDGTVENAWIPVDVAISGRAGIGKYAVQVTGGSLLAASPETNAQADPATRVLRVVFDTFTLRADPVNGFYPVEHLTLRRPDGTTVEGISSTPGYAPVSWTATGGNTIDFPVDAASQGDYELLLSSLSPKGLSTLRPDLIERVGIPFSLPEVGEPKGTLDNADADADADAGLPVPLLESAQDPSVGETPGEPEVIDITAGTMNVGGFLFDPGRMTWDRGAGTAELEGTVRSIETATPSDMTDLVGGLLDVAPQFSFTMGLASQGRFFTGIVSSQPTIEGDEPAPVIIEFLSIDDLDLDDLGLVIGPRLGAASSMPLTADSSMPSYPPAPIVDQIEADPVAAGDWTVELLGYRTGMLSGTDAPRPGSIELEVFLSVSASPSATVRSLGLSFRPSVQLFLAGADGYMQQPVEKNELVFYEPGETKRQSVVFQVPDSFRPGTRSFVLRGADEVTEVTIDQWVETTFAAELSDVAAGSDPGEL